MSLFLSTQTRVKWMSEDNPPECVVYKKSIYHQRERKYVNG